MRLVEESDPLANCETEAALIGALMTEGKLIDAVADRLTVEDFSDPMMARIFSTILREHSLGRSATPVTLRPYFAEDEMMAELGGAGFLATLTESGRVGIIGARDFVDQIIALARRRRLVAGLHEAVDLAADYETPMETLVEAADAAISAATGDNDTIHQPTGAQCIDEVMATFNQPVTGVKCGSIRCLDDLLGPMRPKQLIIGAGRPGMGKTAAALSYAIGAARNGHGVLFVSLEMGSTELGARIAADMCFNGTGGVPFAAISEGRVSGEHARMVSRAREEMNDLPFRVVDIGQITIGRLAMMVRRHKRRMAAAGHKLELVVVDYLQLVHPDQQRKSNYEAVSEVSRGLKAISKNHDVAVFALAQLSREVEKRQDKKPQLSDLRDSGQIEQDADAVLFLFRDEYYLRKEEPSRDEDGEAEYEKWQRTIAQHEGKIEFICAKRRNGREGRAIGSFQGQFQAVRG